MQTQTTIQPGWKVYSSEGEEIGSIADVESTYFVVTKGLFLPKDHYVPFDAVDQVRAEESQVILICTKREFDGKGWDQAPDDAATSAGADYTSSGGTSTSREPTTAWADSTTTGGESLETGEKRTIPRYEEELRAEKTSREAGEVRVRKDVAEEEQSFEVPVTREDVEVRRVPVNRPAGQTDEAFSDGETIRVPVHAEEVHTTKEPRVVEEVEIRKTAHEERQRVGDTVRKERVEVEQQGDARPFDRGTEAYDDDRELAGAGADRMQSQRGWDAETPTDDDSTADEPRL